MYEKDGDFGKVRLVHEIIQNTPFEVMNYTNSFGWHECNEKYRISRVEGDAFFLLFFTMSGKGFLKIEGELHELLPSTIAIVSPNQRHEYFASSRWEFYWIHLTGEQCTQILRHLCVSGRKVFHVSEIGKYAEKFEELFRFREKNSNKYEVEVSLKLSEIAHAMLADVMYPPETLEDEQDIVKKAVSHMEKTYQKETSIDEICKALFVSPAHFIRLFKARTGLTPYEYFIHLRILKACEMLQFSNKQICEIARAVGFKSTSNFILHFKKIRQITPGKHRKSGVFI